MFVALPETGHENYRSNRVPGQHVLFRQWCIQCLLLTYVETLLAMVNADVANTLCSDGIERPEKCLGQCPMNLNPHTAQNFQIKNNKWLV